MRRQRKLGIMFPLLILGLFHLWDCGGGDTGSQEIQNLRAFARLYGYIRYFHPSDEAAEVDWNRFAIYGASQLKSAQNRQELKNRLEELFLPLAPTLQIFAENEKPGDLPGPVPEDAEGMKIIAWQHLGVGLGGMSVYRSVRINLKNRFAYGSAIGGINQMLAAEKYRGKEVRLSAFVKAEVAGKGDQGQLWLRVDRDNQQAGFFENMDDRPIRAREWNLYVIEGKVDEDARSLFIGCFLRGYGKLWIDDVQLAVRSDDKTWHTIDIPNPRFESGGKEAGIPGWNTGGQQASGFTFSVNAEEFQSGRMSLMISKPERHFSGKLYPQHPDIGEAFEKPLGSALFCRVPLALYGDDSHTWGSPDRDAFQELTARMETAKGLGSTGADENIRLGDVIIAWNVFQHFYPYFDVIDADWDKALTDALSAALSDKNETDFFYTLSRMVALLEDGHGNVIHPSQMRQSGPPFKVDWVENRVVITATADPQRFRRGDIITAVDGVDAGKLVAEAEEYLSGSPQWKRFRALQRFGFGESGSEIEVTIKRGEEIFEVAAVRERRRPLPEFQRPPMQELEGGVFYVNLDQADWTAISSRIQEIARARAVIFDLRGYPRGNHQIISHLLTEKDTSAAWMQVPQIIYPDRERIVGYQKMGWNLRPLPPHIQGRVIFITDGRAISYAESFLSFIEHYRLGEIVGQPTAGANGNVNPFDLPGGYRIVWTGMRVVKHDGSQHHTIGILPTVPMERTLQGILDGRDELFDKALEIAHINKEDGDEK